MLRIETILGSATGEAFAGRLHDLAHRDAVETVRLPEGDVARRKLRVVTDKGTDIAIALPRTQRLQDGAVLVCDDDRAIVVRVDEIEWLPLEPIDAASAVELGYHAGNLHWRVRFSGSTLFVGLEGPVDTYLARLKPFVSQERIRVGNPAVNVAGAEPASHGHAHHHHDGQAGHSHPSEETA
ncbi:urease accessory protein UreE [Amorphus orientalis]|uniref:Urease accessory protein UreE n=1 Tax=Amorphus orientalis TaxID=649198 RepID=A0AAE3VQA4_9HYPH|nr:urease accessory protein UreE [Amorphus orientalis]MDQ0315771.1 urease accessory protein [Amorphus orientalis]